MECPFCIPRQLFMPQVYTRRAGLARTSFRVKTPVARGAAGVVGDVGAMPAGPRYAFNKALERVWGDVLRGGTRERTTGRCWRSGRSPV
jgi:hypothetical protein